MDIVRAAVATPELIGPGTIRGYFAVFGRTTYIPDMGAWESIARGAFDAADYFQGDPFAAFNHGDEPLGRVSAGTLRLSEDDKGLAYEIDLPDTALGRDVAALVARGDLKGASFRASALDARLERGGALVVRTRLGLIEGSVVTSPAYAGTSAEMKRNGSPPSLALRHRALGVYIGRKDQS